MGTLCFDFETYDPDLSTKGSGYIWSNIQIIGMGYKIDGGETCYTTEERLMKELLVRHNTWIAHNISYELGIAKHLGVDFYGKDIYCTMVGSYLDDNSRMQHGLEALGRTLLGREKDQQRFGRLVLERKLPIKPDGSEFDYPKKYYQVLEKGNDPEYIVKTREKYIKAATKLAMQNLHVVELEAPDLIEEYCKSDVNLTWDLHRIFKGRVNNTTYGKFSRVNKVLVEMRHRGVRVDLEAAEAAKVKLQELQDEQEAIIEGHLPGVNYRSTRQLADGFKSLGVKVGKTKSGGDSVDAKFLEGCSHPLAAAVKLAKKYKMAIDTFVENIFKFQYKGRIHGQMKLFGARQTGRFSHSTPNLGQIPNHDPVVGPLMRSIFIADEGTNWYCLDFSSQEPRLMAHFAVLCHKKGVKFNREVYNRDIKGWEVKKESDTFNVPEAITLQQAYIANPALDSHTYNMDIINQTTDIGISRGDTKKIALGKAYGMGNAKLADSLKISEDGAKKLTRAFDKGSPHLAELDAYCKHRMRVNGRIRTLGGRQTVGDDKEYKALNKLIQGSAADQTALSMLAMYEEHNIVPQMVVHDEVSSSGDRSHAEKIKSCMENTIALEIPSFTEIGEGKSWAEAK